MNLAQVNLTPWYFAQEAITLLESSLPALIENLGEDSFQVAQVEKLLATFCLQAGESSKAKKHLKEVTVLLCVYSVTIRILEIFKCYRIESVRYGPNASKTKATKEALDILLKYVNTIHYVVASNCYHN